VALVPKDRTIKVPSDEKRRRLENLYQQVRDIRDRKTGYDRLVEIWETQQAEHATTGCSRWRSLKSSMMPASRTS
jgi:hypothetical protein